MFYYLCKRAEGETMSITSHSAVRFGFQGSAPSLSRPVDLYELIKANRQLDNKLGSQAKAILGPAAYQHDAVRQLAQKLSAANEAPYLVMTPKIQQQLAHAQKTPGPVNYFA
jgi:hypothetical protein